MWAKFHEPKWLGSLVSDVQSQVKCMGMYGILYGIVPRRVFVNSKNDVIDKNRPTDVIQDVSYRVWGMFAPINTDGIHSRIWIICLL